MSQTTHHSPEQRHRTKLNAAQIAVLQMLWRFRFATNQQIARYQAKPTGKAVQKRLQILEAQDLIAKRYDSSYKLRGKPAAYYLTPRGARTLAARWPRQPDEPIGIRRLYKDHSVSESFIDHCISVLEAYLALQAGYTLNGLGDYATRTQLHYEHYDYVPSPLPDACIRLPTGSATRYFFLDICEDTQPFFVLVRRIKQYLAYAESDEWLDYADGTAVPTVLFVVQSESMQKRLRKRVARELQASYEDMTFATARLESVCDPEYHDRVWLPIDEAGDDPDEPPTPTTLLKLPSADAPARSVGLDPRRWPADA